jgi:hypothetical protein
MKKIFYLALIAIVATSCKGIYLPYATNHFGAQSQVVLNQANFRVVRNVEVVVDFDNTNMRRAEAEKSAYGELLREAQLTGSQVLINVVIEEVLRKGWHRHQYVAARATIIEFLDEHGNPTVSESYRPTNTHTTTVTAKPTNNSNASVAAQEVETINIQSTQPMASPEDIQKCEQVHKQIVKLTNYYSGGQVFTKYNNIYKSMPQTQENILNLQKIQMVVISYLNSKGSLYPTLENQLKNASSTEAEISVFLSYYKEQ